MSPFLDWQREYQSQKPTSLCPLRLPPKRPRVIIDSRDPTLAPHLAGSAHVATQESPPHRDPRSPKCPPPNSLPDTAGARDLPPTLSADGAVTHPTRPPSGKNWVTSSSTKNQATKESSTTNQSVVPSTRSTSPSTMEIYPSIMNRSPTNQSLSNQSKVSLGSAHSHRTNDQSRVSLRGIPTHETNNHSRVSLGSMLSQWQNDQPRVSAGNILSHWTNNQPSIPSPGSILSCSRRSSFTNSPQKGVIHQQRISLSHRKLCQFHPRWIPAPHLGQKYPSRSNRMAQLGVQEGIQTLLIDLSPGLRIPHQRRGGIEFAKFSLVY